MTAIELVAVLNWRYVLCPDSDKDKIHIATDPWICGPRSLFTCYHPVLFCGTGATGRKDEPGDDPTVYEYFDAIPEGYTLCHYCKRRLEQDIAPLMEEL